MRIIVLVKEVPDTAGDRRLDPVDKTVFRDGSDPIINPLDELALEEAIRLVESDGGEVTTLTIGPSGSEESIRKALAMGADEAIHVTDDALHGACVMQTARVVAAALRTLEWDLVIAGSEATDSRMSVLPVLVADSLAVPSLTFARKLTVGGSELTIERTHESGFTTVSAELPAVVSVVDKINDPRYPSFKGIMAAKKKVIETRSLGDLGLDPADFGPESASTVVRSFRDAPARAAGRTVTDDGGGGVQLADYLASMKFI